MQPLIILNIKIKLVQLFSVVCMERIDSTNTEYSEITNNREYNTNTCIIRVFFPFLPGKKFPIFLQPLSFFLYFLCLGCVVKVIFLEQSKQIFLFLGAKLLHNWLCLSVCSSVCTPLAVLYIAIVYIVYIMTHYFFLETTCSWHVHDMFMTCSRHVHDMFMTCSWHVMTCSWHVHDMFMTCSWHVHDMFMTCSWHVHDMFMTCSWHVHDMFMTCSWHVHDMFVP